MAIRARAIEDSLDLRSQVDIRPQRIGCDELGVSRSGVLKLNTDECDDQQYDQDLDNLAHYSHDSSSGKTEIRIFDEGTRALLPSLSRLFGKQIKNSPQRHRGTEIRYLFSVSQCLCGESFGAVYELSNARVPSSNIRISVLPEELS